MLNPKAQCKICLSYWWNVGIVYCTCGHFLRDGTEENKKFVSTSSRFPTTFSRMGDTTGTVTGRSRGSRVLHREFAQEERQEETFLGFHDRFIRNEKFRKNMIDMGRSEEICREMDKLANEDHTHHITPDEIRVYRNNWWIRSNFVVSDTMPVRHRADFKQALSTLRKLKNQEDTACYQKWQSSSSSWWDWQDSWWHSSSEHHRDDGPSTDRSVKPDGR